MYRYRSKDRPHKESVVSKPAPYLAQSTQYVLLAILLVAFLVVLLSTNYPGLPSTPPSSFRGIACECAPCKTLLGTYGIPAPLACTASTCALCASLSQTVAEAGFGSATASSSTSSTTTIASKASGTEQPLAKQEASHPVAAPPSTAAAPETSIPFSPMDWLHVQPQKALFIGPDKVFDGSPLRGPTHPRITLQNGERVPMHPLGYVDTDTGKTVEWRVAEGDIISYVWDNEKSHFEVFTKATRECAAAAAAVAGAESAPPPLFLDIGANHGLYGLLAAARGCAVEFYDPQRKCNDILEKSVGLLPPEVRARPVKVHHAAVGPEGGPAFSTVYGMICAGRFSRADSGAMKPWVGGGRGVGGGLLPL